MPNETPAPASATTPTATSPVSWANLLSALTAAPAALDYLGGVDIGIPDVWKNRLLILAGLIRVILPYLLRHSTVQAVKNVETVATVAKIRADEAEVKAEVAAASAVEVSERVTAVESVLPSAAPDPTPLPGWVEPG